MDEVKCFFRVFVFRFFIEENLVRIFFEKF